MSSNVQPSTSISVSAAPANRDDAAANTTSSKSKPKRPLSGYNLFYRFKRNKVLEATAWMKRGAGSAATPEEEKRVIDGVLRAPPGLEGLHPGHAVWNMPGPAVNQIRAGIIRREMEGKLFPNEDTRSRVHRKVHGMGFVEMGRVMREMWAGADGFTKAVFCQLADVGKVRYRIMKRAEGSKPTATNATPTPPDNSGAFGLVSPLPVADGQRNAIRVGIAPLCPPPGSSSGSSCGSASPQASTMRLANKKVSFSADLERLEPHAVPRRVSTDSQDVNNSFEQSLKSSVIPTPPLVTSTSSSCTVGSTASPVESASSILAIDSSISHGESSNIKITSTGPAPSAAILQLRNAITDLKRTILSDSIAITGLKKAILFNKISSIEPEPISSVKEVSAQDCDELSGALDEALVNNGDHSTGSSVQRTNDDCSSMIFGKHINDVQTSNVIMSDTNMLNNLGARVA